MILRSPLFFRALSFTLSQGLLSALCAVIIGFISAPGYARLGDSRKYFRWILLTPNLMSPVLVILSLLLSLEKFPFGMGGIILGHVFLNSGLATVWLGESWKNLESQWAPVYFVSGSGFFLFLRKILLPLMMPSILSAFAVIFSFCISSFALPLVFGGGPQNSTLEVLIYEKLKTDADFHSALLIGVVQCIIQIFLFTVVLRATSKIQITQETRYVKFSKFSFFMLPPLLVALFSFLPFLKIAQIAWAVRSELHTLISTSAYLDATTNSILIASGVALFSFVFLSSVLMYSKRSLFNKLPTMSGVVIGLGAILILSRFELTSQSSFIFIIILGHVAVIALPVLRLCFPTLQSLGNQYCLPASQLGASKFLAFRRIFLPLSFKTLTLGCLLGFVWSLGEFSVARVASGEYQTLPLFVENLLSSYRLELASLASLGLLCATLLILFFIEVVTDGVG